ncbi:DUF4352 domain-containing protein [Tepidiforma sp.]|uniref:DUF4352 domain-containing protein n=1 Tax=Tepidiforma sp. TaxID=2682230 RepID=UPI002ADE7CE8|nr:DUF4352 domain-containing protein [Tepidiforma sp.]
MRRLMAPIPFLLVLFAAAACGGGDGDSRTEEGLQEAARKATQAMLKGEYETAYNAFAKECRDQVSLEAFRSSTQLAMTFVQAFLGASLSEFSVEKVEVQNFSPDRGEVRVTLKPPQKLADRQDLADFTEPNEWEPWKWEDGRWVVADCSGLAGFGDAGDTGVDSGPQPTAVPLGSGPKLGETVDAGEVKVTVRAFEDPAQTSPREPGEGQRFVAIDVVVEGVSGDPSVGAFDFSVQDRDGYVYPSSFGEREPALQMTQLAPGRQVRGWVTFEVPENADIVAVYADVAFPDPEVLVADLTRK